jgi:glycosyltransferase involved in cell wall biosynthesis
MAEDGPTAHRFVEIDSVTTGPISLSLDVSAVPIRPGGAGYYTIEVARGLCARDDISLTMVARRDDEERWRTLAMERGSVVGAVPASRPGRLIFEQARFPNLLDSLGVHVHHAPHYTMPERAPVPCVVTIHDCTFFDHPQWHVGSKALLFRRAIRRASLHAGALVCVSDVTASRLRECCDVRVPIVVAPHGVDHERFTSTEGEPGGDRVILAECGVPLDRPLVAFVGTLEPRKGVASLIRAFDRVAETQRDATLVVCGQTGWGMEETERALAGARNGDRILRLGYVPHETVPALLRSATVVAYPALEEGFGLPALEALACGAPLITTEGTAMAEVAHGAAQLVPPGDDDALAAALAQALDGGKEAADTQRRHALGIAVAAQYTWASSVARHVEAYRVALGTSQ